MGEKRKRPEPDWAAFRAEAIAEMIGLGFSDEQAAAEARRAQARAKARFDWGLDLMDELDAAQAAAEAAWARFEHEHGALDDETYDALPAPPEQERLEALLAQVDALVERGQYPRHLHFRGV